jgi:hypothetical protein
LAVNSRNEDDDLRADRRARASALLSISTSAITMAAKEK